MSSLARPGTLEALNRRLTALTPDAPRRWGSMTAHEMVCHLADSFRGMLGERATSSRPTSMLQRQIIRFVALHTPVRWPQGVPTMPEVNPHAQGTRPANFDVDREQLRDLMHRFADPDCRYAPHPMFGALSRREWMVWGYRHVDHHFRQFGI